jgi:hypothetical protein
VLADKPDPETLDKAVSAADDLPAVAYCADVAALTAPFPPPEDPVARAHVNALEQRVDRSGGARDVGQVRGRVPR